MEPNNNDDLRHKILSQENEFSDFLRLSDLDTLTKMYDQFKSNGIESEFLNTELDEDWFDRRPLRIKLPLVNFAKLLEDEFKDRQNYRKLYKKALIRSTTDSVAKVAERMFDPTDEEKFYPNEYSKRLLKDDLLSHVWNKNRSNEYGKFNKSNPFTLFK